MQNFFKVVGWGIIGIVLGIVLINIIHDGYFKHWQQTSHPKNIAEFFSSNQQPNTSNPIKYTKPCDYRSPEFFILVGPPQNIVDCIQRSELYPDAIERSAYVMDGKGNFWEWHNATPGDIPIGNLICLAGLGLLVVLFIGIASLKPEQK